MTKYNSCPDEVAPVSARRNLAPFGLLVVIGMAALALVHVQVIGVALRLELILCDTCTSAPPFIFAPGVDVHPFAAPTATTSLIP